MNYDNPEYKIATEIAEDYLPEADNLSEYGLNPASAQQAGYELDSDESSEGVCQRIARLRKAGMPTLILIQPNKVSGGLEDAFDALSKLRDVQRGQFVIATNGQYRSKDELQAAHWADKRGDDYNAILMWPTVALGDEPGYTVAHGGQKITTAPHSAMVYLNEMVILNRLNSLNPRIPRGSATGL